MNRTLLLLLLAAMAQRARADTLVRPVAVPLCSGPAFPQGRRNGNPPDPAYAADKAIDGNPATFCCLLDDSLTGHADTTIPANAKPPVTGHMVFDLGARVPVSGIRIKGRQGGALNPKDVDFYHFADDKPPAACPTTSSLYESPAIRRIVRHTFKPLRGDAEDVRWPAVTARYIGLRVNSSYESGPVHHNFQLAEVEFHIQTKPGQLVPGTQPLLYARQPTLVATLLAIRERLAGMLPNPKVRLARSPVEGLWERVRQDFPPATHPLLHAVHYGWFADDGWLAQSSNTKLEQRFITRLLGEAGDDGRALRGRLNGLVQAKAPPSDPRWLRLCIQTEAFATLLRQTRSLRKAIDDLGRSFPQYPASSLRRRLASTESELRRDATGEHLASLDVGLAKLRREALVTRNPLLWGTRLLFVKRYTYSPGWYYAEFMRASRFGGNLCVLDVATGQVAELVPKLAGGIFDRFDLSFDGRRVVFGYKAKRGQGFRLWEVGADGTGLRQLTFDPPDEAQRVRKYCHPRYGRNGVYQHHTDDFHPCTLPDGRIVFASTRCERGVLCDQGDSLSVNVLYRINADGSGMHCLSQNALSESTPSVMNDGRVLYTRWEYVDKGVIAIQGLWSMRPDGTGTAEVLGNQLEFPPVLIHGRAVPGRDNLSVCTATMHHPFAVGPLLLLDASRGNRTHLPITNLTPDTNLSIEGVGGFPKGEKYTHWRNQRWVGDNAGPLFCEPWPLADPDTGAGAGTYFLVTCNPDKAWNHPTAYGLWLIDTFGNRVLVHTDPRISCWQPVPLRPRPRPPIVPSAQEDATPPDEATLVLSDVYQGLDGVPRGTVKYLRVLEQVPRPWAARRFWPHDEALGQHAIISLNAHIFVKIHHGIVPVHPDGSAHFTVPARRSLFVQALDADYMEVQRMRSFVDLQPGERRSCVGCHEPRSAAPPTRVPLALKSPPARPAPQPGESVPRPIHYPTDVQPILDKHCVACHNPKKPEGKLDLTGEPTTYFSRSYEGLMRRKLIACIQEFYGPQPRAQKINGVPLPPRSLGSVASKLIAILRKGHYKAALSQAEWLRLITWVDANGPYYGSYFGRRNAMYRTHPDFRPTPTLDSARGIAPKPGP